MMAPCSIWATYTPVKGTQNPPAPRQRLAAPLSLHFELIKQKKLPFLRIEKPGAPGCRKSSVNRPLRGGGGHGDAAFDGVAGG